MSPAERKEANRYYWIVKGHLIPQSWGDDQVQSVLDGYFIRIWGNHENVVHEEGFEEAWNIRENL
jgi:hypothetical protein